MCEGMEQTTPQRPAQQGNLLDDPLPTLGQRAAEFIAGLVGSWWFIILQSSIILCWVFVNVTGLVTPWDAYPFILMNLMLSLQAAYTAPMILMSQNRQGEKDRRILYGTYELDESSHRTLLETLDILRKLERRVDDLAAKVDRVEAGLNG